MNIKRNHIKCFVTMFAVKALVICLLCIIYFYLQKDDILTDVPLEANNDNSDLDSAKIMFMYGPTIEDYVEYDLKDAASLLIKHPKFIHNQTHMFMGGYLYYKLYPGTIMMAISYYHRNTTNFLDLQWEGLANGDYNSAQENVIRLSLRVADFIIELFKLGVPQDSLSLSGQSMGGRGVAVFARDVIERSNGTMIVSRITALDPSNEEAHDDFILPFIEKSFAKFVDVIHTDAGGIGTTKSMGHANFWVNNGTAFQPGCPTDEICSHKKAPVYWAETVAYGKWKPILAYPSESYDELLKNGVEPYKNSAVLMGIDCPPTARGNYYLQHSTNFADYYSIPKFD
ncbi:pancreatic lipase-related protein 2-like isoform X2 [Episyrphus balteatus]|uniref:pancreatic lipase-related protein 2-like isoform X2 n=1 Tax=Episyrphus balteatus TaxID=286459 RepID=UPI002485970E|nr:pancreatic lipase-related protein 2-like isoform X2 [Episyrphus balteatus]